MAETIAAEITKENQQDINPTDDAKQVEVKPDEPTDKALRGPSPEEQRYKRDMLKFKDELAATKMELENRKKRELAEQGRWEELAKENEDRALAAERRAKDLESGIKYDRKYNAVKDLALASGLRSEALSDLELLDFDDVELELTSTGRSNVLNADRAVERLKTSRPHWFGSKRSALNSNDPGVVPSSGDVTMNDLKKAEAEARKSGDYADYQKKLYKFRDQNRSR